jgi:hypothetical protein
VTPREKTLKARVSRWRKIVGFTKAELVRIGGGDLNGKSR